MRNLICLFLIFITFQHANSQIKLASENEENIESNTTDESVIIDANYKGGINNFYNYIGTNFNYNNLKKSDVLEDYKGKDVMVIYLQFFVNEEGKPVDFTSFNTYTDNSFYLEAVRVISSTRWQPASKDGISFKQKFKIPIQAYIRDFQ